MKVEPILDFDYDPPELEELKRCLYMILGTPKGSMPLNRDLGVAIDDFLDSPIDIAKNRYAEAVVEQVDAYEPRVQVTAVVFEESEADRRNGILRPHIYLTEGST